MFLFILIALSGLFPLNTSSILPVQCNAMGHSSFLLTFPCSSRFSLFFIHQLFVLSSGSLYSKKVLYREKKYRIIIFFIPPCNKNICAPLQKFRGDLSDRPLHCPRRLHLCEWASLCAWVSVFKRKGACMLACRPYPCAYLKCAWETEGKYGTDRCVLFSVAALEREVLPVGGKRFIFEYQWLFVESVI